METFSLFEQDPTLLFLSLSMHNRTRQCTPSSHQYDILDKICSKLWSLENTSKFEYSCTISIPSIYFSLIKCKSNCSIFKMKRALYLWAERVIKRVEPCWPRFTCPLSNSWLLGLGSSGLTAWHISINSRGVLLISKWSSTLSQRCIDHVSLWVCNELPWMAHSHNVKTRRQQTWHAYIMYYLLNGFDH